LDIGVDLLVLEAARAEIDNLNSRFVNLSEQNILRLEIAMDDVVLPHVVQRD
jgi:hypothetical protein